VNYNRPVGRGRSPVPCQSSLPGGFRPGATTSSGRLLYANLIAMDCLNDSIEIAGKIHKEIRGFVCCISTLRELE
jgi:hypothetical protein